MDNEELKAALRAQISLSEPLSEKRMFEIGEHIELFGDEGVEEGVPSLRSIIVETLARLPALAYDDLMCHEGRPAPWFIGCGPGQFGQALRRYIPPLPHGFQEQPRWEEVILLSGELCRQPLAEAMFTVAHEIAHVVLGHTAQHALPAGLDHEETMKLHLAKERAADKLAGIWGFDRNFSQYD